MGEMLNKVWDSIEDGNVGVFYLYDLGWARKTILLGCIGDLGCDDLWQGLDLNSIGVPPPETNHSKVLLTTRVENVCDQMQAKKFEVKCLTNKKAFDLFCVKVGEETLNSNPDIHSLAKQLVLESKGLPLALITFGQSMAGQKNPQQWRHVINNLQSFPSKVKVFLGDYHTIDYAFNHGQNLVENSKVACLVEADGKFLIKLHDVIQNGSLVDQDQNKNKILVQQEALKSLESDNPIVEKISIMMDYHHREMQTWNLSFCPHLVSLLRRNFSIINDLGNLQFLNELKVLSFNNTDKVISLPKEIGLLMKLEYFELSRCSIAEKFLYGDEKLKGVESICPTKH
ncbi:putative disease resistance protein At4g10780 [Prosopis cineraria]|uniref:putative disease resistance protein At4g10780 n=1 Tax=Prosopis cineraria TaxID=364024 RepID=UPI0024102AEC|nr:putative disease resistance protein At4g10780 [Prosopis cineraria]